MKIDQAKFPSLFHDGIIVPKIIDKVTEDLYLDIIRTAKKNLFYVASTIMDNVSISFEKLFPLKNELPDMVRGLIFTINGTHHTLMYMLGNLEDRIEVHGQIHCVDNGKLFGDLVGGFFNKSDETLVFHCYNVLNTRDEVVVETVKIIMAHELFLNYAEIETKEVQPNRQIWEGPKALYNNKTKMPVTIVDSAWFTNLISSGAFKVRGHFRLQPYGPELSKRKLVWINEFKKDGYTRIAKKEMLDI